MLKVQIQYKFCIIQCLLEQFNFFKQSLLESFLNTPPIILLAVEIIESNLKLSQSNYYLNAIRLYIMMLKNLTTQIKKSQLHHLNSLKDFSIISKRKKQSSSLFRQIKSCILLPMLLLLTYFTLEMVFYSFFYFFYDIFMAFMHFFYRIKKILSENTMFLLFWSIIIIKTKMPQLYRLFYHTIIKTILSDQDRGECSICLLEDCDYLVLKCQHAYHAGCLQKWIRSNPYCPYCRVKIENKLVRKIPWGRLFLSIGKNKIKWGLVIFVCLFMQYRFECYDIFSINIKQKD